jgi:hypothetical protein
VVNGVFCYCNAIPKLSFEYEYQTSLEFKWSICVQKWKGPIFKWSFHSLGFYFQSCKTSLDHFMCKNNIILIINWFELADHLKTWPEIGWLKTIGKPDTNMSRNWMVLVCECPGFEWSLYINLYLLKTDSKTGLKIE